jgi:hypothetical protein
MPALFPLGIAKLMIAPHHDGNTGRLYAAQPEDIRCKILMLQSTKLPPFDLVNRVIEPFRELVVIPKWGGAGDSSSIAMYRPLVFRNTKSICPYSCMPSLAEPQGT